MTPRAETDVAEVAAVIGDPARARILLALAGGEALPATALAAEDGVAPSTVSGHLTRLREARLVTVELDGRHRYHRLATREVAEALEHLARIARPLPPRTLSADGRARALMRARLCYDHLAGRLGVALMDALCEGDVLAVRRPPEDGAGGQDGRDAPVSYALSPNGRAVLGDFGVDAGRPRRHPAVRARLAAARQVPARGAPHRRGPHGPRGHVRRQGRAGRGRTVTAAVEIVAPRSVEPPAGRTDRVTRMVDPGPGRGRPVRAPTVGRPTAAPEPASPPEAP